MSYAAEFANSYRRVAYFVDKNSKRYKGRRSPRRAADEVEFVINLKTAKQIGVTIQQTLLYLADRVIR